MKHRRRPPDHVTPPQKPEEHPEVYHIAQRALATVIDHHKRNNIGGMSRWIFNNSEDPNDPAEVIVYVVENVEWMHKIHALTQGYFEKPATLPALPKPGEQHTYQHPFERCLNCGQ